MMPAAGDEISIRFSVLAMLGVVLLVVASAYIVYYIMRNHERRKLDDLKSRLQKEHTDKLDDMKQTLLAGVSQELLTPITLIIGPLQQMVSEPMSEDLRMRVHMVLRNAQMLLHQVNMLPVGMRPGMMPQVDVQMPNIPPVDALTPNPAAIAAGAATEKPESRGGANTTDEATPITETTGVDDSNAAEAADMAEETDIEMPGNHHFTMLMVDDSADMCRFVRDYFRGEYNVITANNGEEAVKCLDEIDNIDLVVSDVTMPKMDGLELCKYVKNDLRWSHIPVILLTGHTAEDMEVEGLKMGADDYITKPFNAEMLRLRVKKLIEIKESRQKLFREKMDVAPSEITITSVDEQFIQKATKICEEHMSDTDFSVEVLGRELNMSRTYLYKKLMNITGKGPAEFIRIIRLKRGKQYLEQTTMQITEISAAIGYSTPKRFSENFKAEFNMSPSEYLRKLRAEQQQPSKTL